MRAKDWTSFRGCITTRSELVQVMNRWRAQIKDLEAAMGKDMKALSAAMEEAQAQRELAQKEENIVACKGGRMRKVVMLSDVSGRYA